MEFIPFGERGSQIDAQISLRIPGHVDGSATLDRTLRIRGWRRAARQMGTQREELGRASLFVLALLFVISISFRVPLVQDSLVRCCCLNVVVVHPFRYVTGSPSNYCITMLHFRSSGASALGLASGAPTIRATVANGQTCHRLVLISYKQQHWPV